MDSTTIFGLLTIIMIAFCVGFTIGHRSGWYAREEKDAGERRNPPSQQAPRGDGVDFHHSAPSGPGGCGSVF